MPFFRRALIIESVLVLFLVFALLFAGIQTNNANSNLSDAQAKGTEAANEARAAGTAGAVAFTAEAQGAISEANAVAGEATALAAGTAEAQALATSIADANARATAVIEAEESKAQAIQQADLAAALALAAQAEAAIERIDPGAAYRLAVQAVGDESAVPPASEADVALAKALTTFPDRAALEGHTGPVYSATFNHDGSRILTTSADSTVRLWESYSSIDEMRAEALRRLRFWISKEECLEYFSPPTARRNRKFPFPLFAPHNPRPLPRSTSIPACVVAPKQECNSPLLNQHSCLFLPNKAQTGMFTLQRRRKTNIPVCFDTRKQECLRY